MAVETSTTPAVPGLHLRRLVYPRTRSHSWGTWAGSKEDLRRIGEAFAALAAPRLYVDLAALSDRPLPGFEYLHQLQRNQATAKWTPEAVAPHGPYESLSGPPVEVVDALDPKTVTRFNITAGKEAYSSTAELELTMSSKDGVTLRVESTNVGWLAEAYDTLSREVARCTPRWAFIRTKWARRLLNGLFTAVAVAFFGALALRQHDLWTLVDSVIGWWIGSGVNWLLWRSVPGFEVLPDGAVSKGRRALGVAGVVSLNVAILVAGVVATVLVAAHSGLHR